jgi:hypothetical protein
MNTPAERARDNSIAFECKKDGLQQRQSGDWVLRLTVAAIDMHQTIVMATMGTRFQCVLVEIDDDETPVDHEAIERERWRDIGATKQAGIRCSDPVFWAFLDEECETDHHVNNSSEAAVFVRAFCCVDSRIELDKPGNSEARTKWYQLDNAFQAWRVKENA